MAMYGEWSKQGMNDNDYKYNGKELNSELGLGVYDFGFRFYDPAIARFTGVDPISDKFPHVSTYNYAENEPIANIDLWGLQKFNVTARAFIPQKTLANPNPFSKIKSFAGDNRTQYNANSSNFRVEQSVNLDFDNSSSSTLSNTAAPTVGLDKSGNAIATSEAGSGGTLSSSISNGTGTVNFGIDAGNKISEGETMGITPNINMSGSLNLTPTEDGGFNFSLDLPNVDGFPAFEIFVTDEDGNSTMIFGRNPIESGEGPGSLFGKGEHSFKINGSNSTSPQGPVIDFEDKKNPK